MRRRFTLNDFENSLKEYADEFKMVPSKKVWYGIYNNIHPGRRWPSVSVALLLVFTLVIVGHLNTHNSVHAVTVSSKNLTAKNNSNKISTIHSVDQKMTSSVVKGNTAGKDLSSSSATSATLSDKNFVTVNTTKSKFENGSLRARVKKSGNQISNNYSKEHNTSSLQNNNGNENEIATTDLIIINGNFYAASLNNHLNSNRIPAGTIAKNQLEVVPEIIDQSANLLRQNAIAPDVPANKNFSLIAKAGRSFLHKKSNPNVSWTYFAEPTVSNVILKGKPITVSSATSSLSPSVGVNVVKNKVLHSPSFGLEAGLQLNYRIFNKLKFTTGLEVTYSGYRITSNEVHPTFATLTLKDKNTNTDYSKSYVTHYGNGIGEAIVTLRNYSWQASLPVGLQYQIAGNNKIQFNTTANFEPSLILKSNAFLLSTEGSNYVNDATLLRKWNASSNFGAFISFDAGKLKWQVGPNVRYQWFSTYNTTYTIKEHLIDYGIRVAITK